MRTVVVVPERLFVLHGAANTGVLRAGSKALLFDCCDSVTPAVLAALGIEQVEQILLTQHRRPNSAGAAQFATGGTRIAAPAAERALLEDPMRYWSDWSSRWHIVQAQPGPLVPLVPLHVDRPVADGDVVEWEGISIRVLATPGATAGSLSFLVEIDGRRVCFCGDVLAGVGQVWDLHSLQRGHKTWDYHGFLGSLRLLRPTLARLASCGADLLVPSHGWPLRDAPAACRLTAERLEELWRLYVASSSMNHYFPEVMAEIAAGLPRLPRAEVRANPPFVRYAGTTANVLVSDSGAAWLIDIGGTEVVGALQRWQAEKTITTVEGYWVSHYHYDHIDGAKYLYLTYGCSTYTNERMAEILTHPRRFWLPCVAPDVVPAVRATRHGETLQWHEFRLTFYHFPGQSEYHSGLLAEGHGQRVFFCGDSFSPAGLDDYCAGNRNFLGVGRGFDACLQLLAELQPDLIYNQHQREPFHFSLDDIARLRANLAERYALLQRLLPWEEPTFGTDEHWVRSYPYEQDAGRGATCVVEARITNHAESAAQAKVALVPPPSWGDVPAPRPLTMRIPARSEGALRFRLRVPESAPPGMHLVALRVWWNGRYLGPFRHAVVYVL